jgi:hypothetical protein
MIPRSPRHPLIILALCLLFLPSLITAAGHSWSIPTETGSGAMIGPGCNLLLDYTGMFSFGQGLFFSLTGHSSTFQSNIGIATPRDGQVLFRGEDITGTSPGHAAQGGIGLVPQGCGLAAGRTVEENLSLGGLARSGGGGLAWDRERIYSYFPRIRDKLTVKAD